MRPTQTILEMVHQNMMVQRWNKDFLESRMTSKESCPVWGGAVGKVLYGQLAGRLLYPRTSHFLELILAL